MSKEDLNDAVHDVTDFSVRSVVYGIGLVGAGGALLSGMPHLAAELAAGTIAITQTMIGLSNSTSPENEEDSGT